MDTGLLDAEEHGQGERPASSWSSRSTRIGVLVVALLVASGVLGWRAYEHYDRPAVGDRYEVTFTVGDCATAHLQIDGLTVQATDEIFFDWPSDHDTGTLTLTKVYEPADEDGLRIEGTLELESGQTVKAHGGTTGKTFFTLGCMIRG